MASSPEVGSSEGGAGMAQPSFDSVSVSTGRAVGSTAFSANVRSTVAALGSPAIKGANP